MTGSKGLKPVTLMCSILAAISGVLLVLVKIASSIGSLSSSLEASALNSSTSFSENSPKGLAPPKVSAFFVIVPVLSEHSTSMLAISSIATNLLTIASFLARAIAPTAIVTDKTAGRAAGMPATVKINAN